MRLLIVSGRTLNNKDGDLRQGQAVVKDGGQEPVGQGADGAAAGAGGGQAGVVAAALVQASLPLLVMQAH
jgi:hypothetical protein